MVQICNFPGARRIGPPRDWDDKLDGDCLDIFVADHVDTLTGLPVMFTIYKFSDEEIEAFKNGGSFRLGIVGMKAHPVFNMATLSPAVTAQIQPEPVGELGGVVG